MHGFGNQTGLDQLTELTNRVAAGDDVDLEDGLTDQEQADCDNNVVVSSFNGSDREYKPVGSSGTAKPKLGTPGPVFGAEGIQGTEQAGDSFVKNSDNAQEHAVEANQDNRVETVNDAEQVIKNWKDVLGAVGANYRPSAPKAPEKVNQFSAAKPWTYKTVKPGM